MRGLLRSRMPASGMTLLEMLVALAIMAVSITLIYRAVSSSARGVAQIERSQQVTMLANSLLDAYSMIDPGGMQQSGQHGPYSWQITTSPLAGAAPNAVPLYALHVSISWGDGRQWGLETLRPQRPLQAGEVAR